MAKPFVYGESPFRACGHPGCTVHMSRKTSTYDAGFCAKHGGKHYGRATPAPVAVVPEPADTGIRVALVSATTQYSSADPCIARVSLVREPWL